MKRIIIILSTFFILLSCKESSNIIRKNKTANKKNYVQIDDINSDSKNKNDFILRNKTYSFKLFCNEKYYNKFFIKKIPVFLIMKTFFYDKAPRIFVKKLKKEKEKKYLYAQMKIPRKTNFISIYFYDDNFFNRELGNYEFPVFRLQNNDTILSMNASTYLINIDNPNTDYLNYFNWERENYPKNSLIYLSKWLFEKKNHKLSERIILSDLSKIDSSKEFSTNQKYFLLFFGNFILGRNDIAIDYIKKLSKRYAPDVYNDRITFECFSFFMNNFVIDNETINPIIQNILINNPCSYFSSRLLGQGKAKMLLNANDFNDFFHKRFNKKTYSLVDLLEYSSLLVNAYKYNKSKEIVSSDYKDSVAKARKILDTLMKYYNKPFNAEYLTMGSDLLVLKKQIFFSTIMQTYLALEDYNGLISKSKELISNFKFLNPVISDLYFEIARAYQIKGDIDSSIHYYTLSINLSSNNEYYYSEFKKLIKKNFKVKNIDKYLDSIIISSDYLSIKLPENTPDLNIGNKKISLINNNKPIIIEFFTTSCKPCQKNIETLLKFKDDLSHFDIYLISPELKQNVLEYLENKWYDMPYISNANEILNFFRIFSFPETIIINKNGVLLKRVSGVYNAEFINSLKNIKN